MSFQILLSIALFWRRGGDNLIIRKNLITAILCTFCLATILLSLRPVDSSTGQYDPWLDVNEDGRINVLDLIKVAGSIGTSGNPLKSVVKVIRFYNSSEFEIQFRKEVARFDWYPQNSSNNALLSLCCYMQYSTDVNGSWPFVCTVHVYDSEGNHNAFNVTDATPILGVWKWTNYYIQPGCFPPSQPYSFFPNQPHFRFHIEIVPENPQPAYHIHVKNINLAITFLDGVPPS